MRETIWKIISYGLLKKWKYFHKDFNCWIKTERIRVLHPLGFIFLIFAFIVSIFEGWIINWIKEIKETFCII